MNEELDSQLSAMFDDELPSAECELLARRLSRDGELKARWGRYAVIGAAIRAERGVRLNARVAGRVSALVRSEPALGTRLDAARPVARWWRALAGSAVAAGVAAVSILWLRGQEPGATALAAARLASASAVRAEAPPPRAAFTASRAGAPDSYVVPPAGRAPVAIVPTTELANYVVAHSMVSAPLARRNLLSAFMTSEPGEGSAAPEDPPEDAPPDVKLDRR
jgi:sigma-E factor negative regulatory protein RseA